ncbi:MAG TPA: DUF6599 family protein [Terriglobia bacterium]|nr:DUF6599 family protein [Terriglobia bacterium]
MDMSLGFRRSPFFSVPPCLCVGSSLAILTLSLSLACGSKSSSKPATYFPESNEAPGWSKSGETRTFPADRLWEYIDGDADKYVQAGVQQTLTTDYRYGDKIEAVADVYVMATADGAEKAFESQATTGSQSVPLGDAARLYKGSLTLRKNRYFVRLVAYEDLPEAPQALVALGRAIAGKLDQK